MKWEPYLDHSCAADDQKQNCVTMQGPSWDTSQRTIIPFEGHRKYNSNWDWEGRDMTTSSFKNHHRPYLQSTKHRLLHVVLKWCNLYMLHRKDSDRDNMEYRIKSDILEKRLQCNYMTTSHTLLLHWYSAGYESCENRILLSHTFYSASTYLFHSAVTIRNTGQLVVEIIWSIFTTNMKQEYYSNFNLSH